MKRPTGLCDSAQILFDRYDCSQRAVAEAFLKGEIPSDLIHFVWDLVEGFHVEDAKLRLNQRAWALIGRVAKLEEEICELRARLDSADGDSADGDSNTEKTTETTRCQRCNSEVQVHKDRQGCRECCRREKLFNDL